MNQRAQLATSAERYKQQVDKELDAFEKLENQLNAQERRERAAKLGLALDSRPLKRAAN
jgi:hypothetical protein